MGSAHKVGAYTVFDGESTRDLQTNYHLESLAVNQGVLIEAFEDACDSFGKDDQATTDVWQGRSATTWYPTTSWYSMDLQKDYHWPLFC